LDPSLSERLDLKTAKRYYEVLTEYYCTSPEKAAEIERIEIDILWDDYQFQIISGLILHKWVFSHNEKRKQFNNFIKTANKLFWLDVEHSTRRFQPVYDFLYKNILASTERWSSEQIQRIIMEIFALVAKFFFYYNKQVTQDILLDFLTQTQVSLLAYGDKLEFPKGHHKIQTLNMFVNEVVRHIKLLHNEATIVLYLEKCAFFRDALTIPGTKTKINLQTVLLDYSTPGSPFYPTRKIREAAKKSINLVFPGGKITRQATNWVFRFLSPIELLKSWWFWIVNWISAIIFFLSGLFHRDKKPVHQPQKEFVAEAKPQEHEVTDTPSKQKQM